MKLQGVVLVVLCVALCGYGISQAQEMDKELSDLATKLATLTKDNAKKKVTVLDFTDLQGGATELGKYIAEELTVGMVMVKRDFSVLDRANLRKVLSEHKLTASGLVDPENAKKLGMFAGVDALILGTIIPKNQKISLTAKIITTDTAEIVGAARAEFKTDETVQQLISQPAKADEPLDPVSSQPGSSGGAAKPFGDLQARVESLKMLPGNDYRGFVRLTLVITNTSTKTTYGVALAHDYQHKLNISNSRQEEFEASDLAGISTIGPSLLGVWNGSLTDIPPRSSIVITTKNEVRWTGKPGDFRPYRLQTEIYFAVESQGRYSDIKTHNLLVDIK